MQGQEWKGQLTAYFGRAVCQSGTSETLPVSTQQYDVEMPVILFLGVLGGVCIY